MRQPCLQLSLVALAIIVITSCKKEPLPKETPSFTSKRAIAVAGPDQSITLPVDSIQLDGSMSVNTDGTISEYLWRKISGPTSFTIANSSAIKSMATNLAAGTYQFELKVTFGSGLFSTDTVQVLVFVPGACNPVPTINVVSGSAAFTPFGSLSSARSVIPATAVDKIVFGGGDINNDTYSDEVDIYNFSTNMWSTAKFSKAEPKRNITVENKILFIGESNMDVYDAVTNTWSATTIDRKIIERRPTVAAVGNKVLFAGGSPRLNNPSSQVDIYDISLNTWSTASLSEARIAPTTITVGTKIIFAGGYKTWDAIDYPSDLSKSVDVFDASNNSWSTSQVPIAAFGGSAAASGNKAMFHFENTPDKVLIYDIAANTWSTATLSAPRFATKVISVGNELLVVGGEYPNMGTGGFATVDIYDATSNTWSTTNLNHPGRVMWSATLGNKLLLSTYNYGAGGPDPDYANVFDVYDASSNTSSVIRLNYRVITSPVVADNKIFFGGGYLALPGSSYLTPSCQIFKLQL